MVTDISMIQWPLFSPYKRHYQIVQSFNLSFKNLMILRCFWLTKIPFDSGDSVCLPTTPQPPPQHILPATEKKKKKKKQQLLNYSKSRGSFLITNVPSDFLLYVLSSLTH